MLYVVPFVAKIMEGCAKSKVKDSTIIVNNSILLYVFKHGGLGVITRPFAYAIVIYHFNILYTILILDI